MDKWDGVTGLVTYPLLTSKHFLLNTAHSGTPKCWFTEGVGRGERELSSTFDQVTLFSPPLPLLIVSRFHACMRIWMYMNNSRLPRELDGKMVSSVLPLPSPIPLTLHVMLTCMHACVYKCTQYWLGSWKREQSVNDWSSSYPSVTQHKLLSRLPWELEGEWSSPNMDILTFHILQPLLHAILTKDKRFIFFFFIQILIQDKVRYMGMPNSKIYANSRASPKTKEK